MHAPCCGDLGSVLHVSDLETVEVRKKGESAVLRNLSFPSEVFPLSEPFSIYPIKIALH